jgi:hypothetical protein
MRSWKAAGKGTCRIPEVCSLSLPLVDEHRIFCSENKIEEIPEFLIV